MHKKWKEAQVITQKAVGIMRFVVMMLLGLYFLTFYPRVFADDSSYRKATGGKDVVKQKLFPKNERFELSLPNVGMIMNQSYIETFLISGGFNYFLNETWGFGIDISIGANKDKYERTCVESFYNDPSEVVEDQCGGPEILQQKAKPGHGPNYGPAYVPIREMQNIITFNAVWNPVYGKALLLLSRTIYFDLYVEMGGGIVTSTYYPKMRQLKNGNISRGPFSEPDGAQPTPPLGADPYAHPISYGVEGRPDPQNHNNVMINLGIGQKFHFARNFHVKVYLRNFTLLGTPSGFENLLALYTGLGMRF